MTAAPIHAPAASNSAAAPASRMPQRIILAVVLWLLWCAPLITIELTAPKFMEIFREFGVKLTGGVVLALQIGGWMGSPLGMAFMLLALPALAFATAALILPPRIASSAPQRSRWPLVVISIVCSLAGAIAVWILYSAVLAQAMLPIIDKLQKSPPPAAAAPAESPAR